MMKANYTRRQFNKAKGLRWVDTRFKQQYARDMNDICYSAGAQLARIIDEECIEQLKNRKT